MLITTAIHQNTTMTAETTKTPAAPKKLLRYSN